MAQPPRGVRPQSPINPFSSLVRTNTSRTDPLEYRIQPPTTPAPGTSYGDFILQQVFGVQSPVRAQKVRKLDPKSEQWVAANSENMTRNRPEFIRQAMLSGNPALMDLVSEGFKGASDKVKLQIGQEIAERFPNPRADGGVAAGWSPEAQEVIDFLKTGQVSLERAEALDAVRQLEESSFAPRQRQDVPGEAANVEDVDPDADAFVDFSPESNVPGQMAPGDPILDAGVREFRKPDGMGEGLRTSLDTRPGTRAGKSQVSAEGDKVNPKTERFDTQMVKGPDGKLIPVRQAQGDPVFGAQDNPAINAANRGRRPYPMRDYEAERSLKSEQQILADNLRSLMNGDPGAADRVWNMVKLNSNRSPLPPSADGLVDYALALITDQDALAGVFRGQSPASARARMVEVADARINPSGEARTLTREQAAAEDAAFDAQAIDPASEVGYRPDVQREVTPEQTAEYQARREAFERATGRGSGYLGTVLSDVLDPRRGQRVALDAGGQPISGLGWSRPYGQPFMPLPVPPRPAPPPTPIVPGGNVGRAGAPQSRQQSQAADAFPQGLDQNLRPISAIEGRGPRKGSAANKDVDAVGGRENLTERAGRDPIRLRGKDQLEEDPYRVYADDERNIELSQINENEFQEKALRNSAAYAHSKGKVVFDDGEGNVIAQNVDERMLEKSPEKVQAIRSSAMQRMLAQVSDQAKMRDPGAEAKLEAEFNYMWPEGDLPLPQYFDWANSVDPTSPQGLTPSQESAVARMSSDDARPVDDSAEIEETLAQMRQGDADAVERARQKYEDLGLRLGDRIPPGFVTRPDGQVVASRFGFEADDIDQATSAPDMAQRAAAIIRDPNASPAALKRALKHHAETKKHIEAIPDPELRQMAKEVLLDPLDQAAAARIAPEPGNVTADLAAAGGDPMDLGASEPEESGPVVAPSPVTPTAAEIGNPDPEVVTSAGARRGTTTSPEAIYDATGRSLPIDKRGWPAGTATWAGPQAASAMDDVNAALDAAASPVDDQPSANSPDNRKPQQSPRPEAEGAAKDNANASKQASDAESAKAEETAAGAEADDWDPNSDPYGGFKPRTKTAGKGKPAADKPGMMARAGSAIGSAVTWPMRNKVKTVLGAGGLLGAAAAWNSATTSDPFPGVLDGNPAGGVPPEGGDAVAPEAESMTPEQRIRMMARQRGMQPESNPYPRQTLWRVY